jgi:hypothetical protein
MTKLSISRRTFSLAAVFLMLFSAITPSVALAIDVDFFSNNDILYYDPEACSVVNQSGDFAVVGNDNAEKIFNFLTTTNFKGTGGKPFNAVQAAGALGNFQQESAMNPAAVEPNGAGHGLAQWSFGRWDKLQALAQKEGKPWSDLGLQLLMIQNELNDVDSDEGTRLLAASEFATVTDPARASYIFQLSYERAGVPSQQNRDRAALSYYDQFKDKAPAATTTGSSSSSSTACATAGGGGSSDFVDGFTFYNQCHAPWGSMTPPANTVCYNACGPTSTAMAITNLTGQKVTPLETTKYVSENGMWMSGGGTTFDTNVKLAQKWGLKASTISAAQSQDINYVKKVLDDGGLVMVAGQPGPRPYWSIGAHFILIRAITKDGQILIANPAPTGPDDNTRQWPVGDILNGGTFGGVVFTK